MRKHLFNTASSALIITAVTVSWLCASEMKGGTAIPLAPRTAAASYLEGVISGTVKILAIRVEFQPDTLRTTTGDGSFNSGIPPDVRIDPLPHNQRYFQDQLLFLKNFYEDISAGGVNLDIHEAVYPLAPDSAYLLPHPMWHYNYNNEDYLDLCLARLFRDAWTAASKDNDIDFSDFDPVRDCFIIFHAGVGKDFAFDFDPTPFDIPSAYMELADLAILLPDGVPNQGIAVRDSSYFIERGMILPETENQEGYELGMHGHMAILFGHHIGLPNLFNTETGQSVLGWFGLMDQGSGKVDGLVPAPPSAWTKVFAGWIQPIIIDHFPDTVDAPIGTIFKIPITDKEYFLIENIDSYVREGVSWDSLRYSYYKQYDDYPVTLDLLIDSVDQYIHVTFDPVSGVLTDIDNWGIGRPASGLLIWHIDETVMEEDNGYWRINNDPDRLGVRLMEADGAFDIGQPYGLFSPGRGTELGSPYDAFFQDNVQHLDANPGSYEVIFSDFTFPSARANSGAFTHLVFKDFSPIADTMSFTVSNDLLLPGFPKGDVRFPFTADIDGDGLDELFAVDTLGLRIFGWRGDGTQVGVKSGNQILPYFALIDTTRRFVQAAAADFDGDEREELAIIDSDFFSFTHRLVIIDYLPDDSTVQIFPDGNILMLSEWGFPPVFFIAADSLVYSCTIDSAFCWEIADNQPQMRWRKELRAASACLMPSGGIVTVNQLDNVIYHFAPSGITIWAVASPFQWLDPPAGNFPAVAGPAAADIDRDGEMEIVFVYQTANIPGLESSPQSIYLLILTSTGAVEAGYPLLLADDTSPNSLGNLSLGDIDDDGWLEIIFPVKERGIWVYERNGVINDYFPYSDAGAEGTALVGKDSHNRAKLFYTSRNRFQKIDELSLRALDFRGGSEPGFPLQINPEHSPILLTKIRDDAAVLTFSSYMNNNNYVYAYLTDIEEVIWGSERRDKGNTALLDVPFVPPTPSAALLPADKVYNWPNPVNPGENATNIRYYLNNAAAVNIKIYDMAGDKVDELCDTGTANAWNEAEWDVGNISSGVYLARVEACGGGKTEVRFIKIAVIK